MKFMMGLSTAVFALLTGCAEGEPAARETHLFYFHGRIVEDGLPAISRRFGEYQFTDIVAALDTPETIVHAKQRGADADIAAEATEALEQIDALLDDGVPANRIAIVGASKGSQIAAEVSHRLANADIRLVILAGCWPQMVETALAEGADVYGDVLEIRDIEDRGLEPGCGALIEASPNVGEYKQIVTDLGVSHGLIYHPYDEWLEPTLEWVTAD